MNTENTQSLRKLVSFLNLKPSVTEVWLNNKGDYQLSQQKGFDEKVTREEVLEHENDLPAEEVKENTVESANVEHLMITVNQANEALVSEKGKVAILEAKLEAAEKDRDSYKAQVGELIEGEDEAELQPRNGTWLQERRESADTIEALKQKIDELEALNVKQPT